MKSLVDWIGSHLSFPAVVGINASSTLFLLGVHVAGLPVAALSWFLCGAAWAMCMVMWDRQR